MTYDIKDKALIIHCHKAKLKNMVFCEHKSGLYVYKLPTKRKLKGLEQVIFINTVRENTLRPSPSAKLTVAVKPGVYQIR